MKDAELLGFFWTDCPGADFAMVTSQGLELFALKPQGLRATAVQRLASPQWFLWSHSCRVLVTGCGSTGAKLQSFQFTLRGLIRLPLLDLTPPWGSPTKAASSTAPWLLVSPAQVWVLLLYQRVFIAHQDAGMGVLRLYRLYRDATALRVEIPVPDGPMEPSVVDNVLIIHNLENGTVRLVDVAAAIRAKGGPVCQLEPVCPPAPLGIAAASTQILFDGPPSPLRSEEGSDLAAGLDSSSAVAAVASDAMPSSNRVELYHPEFALDAATGRLLTLKLDLQAVEATCLDPAVALAFVMRRRRSVVPRRDPWHVTLSVLRRLVAERSSPVVLRAAFDAVHAAMAADAPHQAHRSGAGPQNLQDLDDEVVAGVLHSVLLAAQTNDVAPEDSHAKEAIASNLLYLQAAVAELLASCNSHGVRAAPAAAELYIKVYCLRGQMDLLSALLESHAQLLDSSVLAAQLDACARGSRATDGPPSLNGEALQDEDSEPNFEALPLPVPPELARRLAQAMYMRLGDHAAVCRGLMRDGKLMEALRHIKRSGLQGSMVAQECADAAEAMGDAQLVAAAERMLDA